jgi:hypothetical protein
MDPKLKQCTFDERVAGRAGMARELLKPERAALVAESGLLVDDLTIIAEKGEEAAVANREQQAQLAEQKTQTTALLENRTQVESEGDFLRSLCPAVALRLARSPDTRGQAEFLRDALFEHYRIQVRFPENPIPRRTPDEPTPAPEAQPSSQPTRTRVRRQDRYTWAQSLWELSSSLLAPEHPPILEALAARGMSQERLERLSAEAKSWMDRMGTLRNMAVEATAREAAAVAEQKAVWSANQRLIRRAVGDDPILKDLWSRC